MNKKVIVFGATGTLGAHITTHLQQKGYQVYAVGHRKSDNGFFGDYNVPYYSLDIENMEQFRRLPQSGINTVLHFAGVAVATYPVVENVVRFVSSNTRLFFDVIFSLK